MKETGEIVGYYFEDSNDGLSHIMFRRVRYGDLSELEDMGTFTTKQRQDLERLRERILTSNPEPSDPRTNWTEFIKGL